MSERERLVAKHDDDCVQRRGERPFLCTCGLSNEALKNVYEWPAAVATEGVDPVVSALAEEIAYIAERYSAAYYADDPDWPSWLSELRKALSQLEAKVCARNSLIERAKGLARHENHKDGTMSETRIENEFHGQIWGVAKLDRYGS
jgi:hypothetical protein